MMKIFSPISFALLLFSQVSFAAKFANQFVEFELPPKWQCLLEGAEWVCQSKKPEKKSEAIIVLAAKLKGTQDSLDQYLGHLKRPKVYTSIRKRTVQSKPNYAKSRIINNHTWVDSLHLDSEIPGFYTRYFATVKSDIGVLVTYSVKKDKYKDYIELFENMVNTLKVFRRPGSLNAGESGKNLFETISPPQGVSKSTIFAGLEDETPRMKKPQDDLEFYLIVAIIALGLIWFIRKRKKKDEED